MIFDIHIHTRKYSDDSFIVPEDLIRQAVETGLDGLALTEHGMRWPDKEFEKLRRTAESSGIVLINGQEIYTADEKGRVEGEFLVFGVPFSLTEKFSAAKLVDRVHAEGGIAVAAHPYKLSRNGRTKYYGVGDRIYDLPVDAVELQHPDHHEQALEKVRKAMRELRIPGTGGSDAHKIFAVGSHVTVFETDPRTEAAFIQAVRDGRIRAEKLTNLPSSIS